MDGNSALSAAVAVTGAFEAPSPAWPSGVVGPVISSFTSLMVIASQVYE